MGLLFKDGSPPFRPNRNPTPRKSFDEADDLVVGTFKELQSIRRRQAIIDANRGLARVSREERHVWRDECKAWEKLMRCLTRLPPPSP